METSPGHLQAWVQVSTRPLPAAVASAIGRELARLYHGDRASTDWRQVGRLAGFTNQKPHRRRPSGLAPWVKVLQATPGLTRNHLSLLRSAWRCLTLSSAVATRPRRTTASPTPVPPAITAPAARTVYQTWLHRLRISQRFPHPDGSVADLWVAKELLLSGRPAAEVKTILQSGSPDFPRRHPAPEDYLKRTLARASAELATAFSARLIPNPFP